MSIEKDDQLQNMLEDGWNVAGYATAMMAAGGMVHSVLLQRGSELTTINVIKNGSKEVGRTVQPLSPTPSQAPPPTKSFWGN